MHKKKTSRIFSYESILDVFLFYKKYSPINAPVLLSGWQYGKPGVSYDIFL